MLVLGFCVGFGSACVTQVFSWWAWWVHLLLHIFNKLLICRRGFASDVTQNRDSFEWGHRGQCRCDQTHVDARCLKNGGISSCWTSLSWQSKCFHWYWRATPSRPFASNCWRNWEPKSSFIRWPLQMKATTSNLICNFNLQNICSLGVWCQGI